MYRDHGWVQVLLTITLDFGIIKHGLLRHITAG